MMSHDTHSAKFRGQPVGVVFGGDSDEREVSLRTGRALGEALESLEYGVTMYDVPTDIGRLVADRPAAVLLGLHGGSGENGTFQGFLETLKIPYSGSGVLASALAMDKGRAKALLRNADVPTPHDIHFRPGDPVDLDAITATLGWPVVAKVNDGGSSVGVYLCHDRDELQRAIDAIVGMHIGATSAGVLVEQYIVGDEFTVGFFDETPLGVIEVKAQNQFYDFEAKYQSKTTEYVPLEGGSLRDRLLAVGRRTYDALGCRGVARVDVMVDANELWVLEVNTIPGMTETSLVPKMARALGLSFAEFAERMLDSATLDAPR